MLKIFEERYEIYNKKGNKILVKFKDGYWERYKYDKRNNLISTETSKGDNIYKKYNEQNEIIVEVKTTKDYIIIKGEK